MFIGLLCDDNLESQFIAVDEACVPLALGTQALTSFNRSFLTVLLV
jgi:hypothetical protein